MSILLQQEKVYTSDEMYALFIKRQQETRWHRFTQWVKRTVFRKTVLETDTKTSLKLEANGRNLREEEIHRLFKVMDAPGSSTRNLADAKHKFQ